MDARSGVLRFDHRARSVAAAHVRRAPGDAHSRRAAGPTDALDSTRSCGFLSSNGSEEVSHKIAYPIPLEFGAKTRCACCSCRSASGRRG